MEEDKKADALKRAKKAEKLMNEAVVRYNLRNGVKTKKEDIESEYE